LSLGAIAFVGIISFLISPKDFIPTLREGFPYPLVTALWLPWSILIDYISLLKTRVILRVLARTQLQSLAIALLAVDMLVYALLFTIGLVSIGQIGAYFYRPPTSSWFNRFDIDGLWQITKFLPLVFPTHISPPGAVYFTLFWAGFVPSIWMWLYVLALVVTRALLRSEKLINFFRYVPVETNPFRSIGAVAATLALIASVAIILVSVEVFRISAAT
jgi:hypothetical protein